MSGVLANSVAVVTEAGHGLGRAVAVALAHESASVAVVAASRVQLEQTVQLIQSANGRALAFVADAANPASTTTTLQQIRRALGPIDLLVNHVAMDAPVGPLVDADPIEWWRAHEVNLRGPMLWTHAVLRGMIEQRNGRIINVASGAGTTAIPFMSAYVTSKTALIRFTEVLAQEVKHHGLRVFAIEPGTVRSAMTMYALESPAGRRWIPWYRNILEAQEDIQPEYAARLIVRLARGEADRLTGRFISRDDDLDLILRQAEKAIENEWGVLRVRGR
jgi:NAD(P)-dependent dehydrogenase (short-subunit alcohol dehydrogenase family)